MMSRSHDDLERLYDSLPKEHSVNNRISGDINMSTHLKLDYLMTPITPESRPTMHHQDSFLSAGVDLDIIFKTSTGNQ